MMNDNTTSTLTPEEATSPPSTLTQFKIESKVNALYKNGRMQAKIVVSTLGVSPDDDAKTAPLTAQQLDTIRLIDYETEGRLTEPDWYEDDKSNEFDHVIGNAATSTGLSISDSNCRSRTFYLRASTEKPTNTYTLGAEIKLGSGRYDKPIYLSKEGEYKNPITLQTVNPLSYDLGNYSFSQNERATNQSYSLHKSDQPCSTSTTVLGVWNQINYEAKNPLGGTPMWRMIRVEGPESDPKSLQLGCFNHHSKDEQLRLLFLWDSSQSTTKRKAGFEKTPLYNQSNSQPLYCTHAQAEIEPIASTPAPITVSALFFKKPDIESTVCDWKLTKAIQHRFECLDRFGNSAGFWHVKVGEKENNGKKELELTLGSGWSAR